MPLELSLQENSINTSRNMAYATNVMSVDMSLASETFEGGLTNADILDSENDTLIISLLPIIKSDQFVEFVVAYISGLSSGNGITYEFRRSTDNYNWTEWVELTPADPLELLKQYLYQIKLTRYGTSGVPIVIDSFAFRFGYIASTDDTLKTNVFLRDTPFNDIAIGDIELVGLATNLYYKMYYSGVLPEFISRENDFKDFWYPICYYFSMFYTSARRFKDMNNDAELLALYLEQEGLFLSGEETLSELQNLALNFYRIIAKRGSTSVAELKRLINYKDKDEFVHILTQGSFVVGETSPMYKGLTHLALLNKMYENEITSKSNFILFNSSAITILNESANGVVRNIFRITASSDTNPSGVGIVDYIPNNSLLIPINKNVDYEISFFIKRLNTDGTFEFGAATVDADYNIIDGLESMLDGSTISTLYGFIEEVDALVVNRSNVADYIHVRAIIFKQNTATDANSKTNCGVGQNARFKASEATKYIYPQIKVTSMDGTSRSAKIYGIRVAPLKTDYSRVFVSLPSFIVNFSQIQNKVLTSDQVISRVKKYLVGLTEHIEITKI